MMGKRENRWQSEWEKLFVNVGMGWEQLGRMNSATGNSRELGRQWGGKQSGREQDTVRRDGRPRDQKPRT